MVQRKHNIQLSFLRKDLYEFLMQHFCKLLEVPEAPGVVPDRGAKEPAGGVVRAPGYTRVVTLRVVIQFCIALRVV